MQIHTTFFAHALGHSRSTSLSKVYALQTPTFSPSLWITSQWKRLWPSSPPRIITTCSRLPLKLRHTSHYICDCTFGRRHKYPQGPTRYHKYMKYLVKTDLKFPWYKNYACTRTNHNACLPMSPFKTLYWTNKIYMELDSFSTKTASFANFRQRHKILGTSCLFLLEVKRLQHMLVGIPRAQIPAVIGWSLLTLPSVGLTLNYKERMQCPVV